MSSLLPLASYNIALEPYTPTQAIESDLPVTVHLTLAALDPTSIDDDEQPSTLRILKSSAFANADSDDSDYDSEDDLDEVEEDAELNDEDKIEEDEESEEGEEGEEGEEAEEGEEKEEGDSEDDDEDFADEDDEVEEYVICTLSPKSQYQQTLDLTIAPDEEVYFVVTGSYPIHISGNYVEHPYDGDEDDFDSEDEDDEEYDSDEYDLTPDEDELAEDDFDIDQLDDEEDVESKIQELVDEEEEKKSKKEKKAEKKSEKKREAEEVEAPAPKETKKQKKEKAAEEKKAVEFKKGLEQGPTKSEKKPATKTLAGGVVIEDRTVGKGPVAKNGSKVGVRYIGKLKNGSVFDKNTSGKPFQFNLGKGEVIKGWDIGVAGMAVGGERRIIVPAPFAYGKKKLPGIPANSELTFDVKLVSLK